MVTALVLQLIQCSVKIEKKSSIIMEEEVSPEVLKVRLQKNFYNGYIILIEIIDIIIYYFYDNPV